MDETAHRGSSFLPPLLGYKPVMLQLDCGVSCNIIPICLFHPDTQLEDTQQVQVIYSNSTLKPSKMLCKCRILEFMVFREQLFSSFIRNKAVLGRTAPSDNILIATGISECLAAMGT